ncbi:hypothetical protein QJ857_gp0770 [Tupanvirus soda lake]|uniref:Uncharacterized protein n=2 Tax=Tupanvirus TaxID=2094720 RepID=A0A6N1NUX7_9VIRU|nr:hypothetical protein QJ857_gp0770 [Tupanvirus soda lake]QKU35278.1 hypothetical protein [Tupanvirus soda lake]
MINIPFYYEECNKSYMPSYPFFNDKLKAVQKLCKKIYVKDINIKKNKYLEQLQHLQSIIKPNHDCDNCDIKKFYKLGNIVWANTLLHKIKNHQSYPSEYFIKVILALVILNDYIINPPIQLDTNQINSFTYIPLHYNKLLIIDALMHQGSKPRYLVPKIESKNAEKYIYSEHSGAISIKNKAIDNIIVSAETNRMDITDDNIYLPTNTEILGKHEYIFHTHPNTSKYGGRISEGIIYEFPSANDLFNFIKYHNEGKAQASIVVAPEGTYVIRPIKYQKIFDFNYELFYHLRKFILKLEKMAIKKIKPIIDDISDPDIFHKEIGSDFTFIKLFNKFIEPANLFIEFYPRIKKNGEWYLRQINLPYIEK